MAMAFLNISFSSSSLAILFIIAWHSGIVTSLSFSIDTGVAFETHPWIVDFDMPYSRFNSAKLLPEL